MQITLDGKKIDFSFKPNQETLFRITVNDEKTGYQTNYFLSFENPLDKPGAYKITGKYRGTAFTIDIIVVAK